MEQEKKGNFRPDSVFSKKIRAGKRRTYFFDVKSTRANDYFLTITESKKRHDDSYERFKIFVYKEDLNKFVETLQETIDHIKHELMPDFDFDAFNHREEISEHHNVPANESRTFDETSSDTDKTNSSAQQEGSDADQTNFPINEPPPAPIQDNSSPSAPPSTAGNEDDLKW